MKSSSFRVLRAISFALLVISIPALTVAESLNGIFSTNYESPRMATYDNASGETTFALSMMPQVDDVQQSSDVVIYVDTSASQTGAFKKDSILTLKTLLGHLSAADRVKLYAVDLDPVALNQSFVRPDSDELKVALEQLEQRVSLGSTDLTGMLKSAVAQLSQSKQNKNVIYIGDGISRGGLLHTTKFQSAVESLSKNQISVSSYAIGPERNIELLASLANATGGNIFIDTDDDRATEFAADNLADTIHGTVFWPQKSEFPKAITEFHPSIIPPLRSDRDTILVGTLANRGTFELKVIGELNGETKMMTWPVVAEESSVDFSFLPGLVEFARKSGGMMPTVGSAGLVEVARTFSASSQHLAALGNHALMTGNVGAAKTLANAALKADPLDAGATAIAKLTQDDDPFGEPVPPAAGDAGQQDPPKPAEQDPFEAETVPVPAQDPPAEQPKTVPPGPVTEQDTQQKPMELDTDPLKMVDPNFNQDEVDQLLRQADGQATEILDIEDKRINVVTDRMKKIVEVELERGRKEMNTAPGESIRRWKSMINVLDQTVDVLPTVRQDLRNRLESALMSARREKIDFDNKQALLQRREAAVAEAQRTIEAFQDREEMMSRLLNRFDALLAEKKYDTGQEITWQAVQLDEDLPDATSAYETARVARYYEQQWELRRRREYNLVAALYESDKSNIAFPANPPLVFPDPLVWAEKKERRKKYQSVRLAGNINDERILNVLDQPVDDDFVFDEQSFEEVMDYLRDKYKITIVLDTSAKDDALTEDEPITFSAAGIRLKNALRLMLKEKNATYIVRNEVLQIISIDVAADPEYFVTNVYNVGDLVAPRQPIGGFGGGGGGFGGGQGGGGFGGGGQGGGGFGGGGQGGGGFGGGGQFCIQDSLTDTEPVSKLAQPETSKATKMLVPPKANTPFESWSQYFEKNFASPADVRYTVRRLTKQKQHDQVIGLIQASLKHNQSQNWMYEAMVLSMQMSDWPKTDIERALMSTVDLSDKEQDAMVAADYMTRIGMEKRALQLLQDLSLTNSTRPEPYVIGLRAAQKINDVEGIKWASLGILSQAWPEHRDVVKKAIYAAKGIRKQMEQDGLTTELAEFNKQLDDAMFRDCIIKVSWTGDADIDLFVEEPGGTVCSRNNQRTTAGGVMMGDSYSSNTSSGETAEYYVLPKGFSGDYRLLVKKVWGEVTAGKVNVSIYNHFRTDKQVSQTKQLEVDEDGTLVLFKLTDGRRIESLEDHAIRTVAANQAIVSRNVLAQQFDNASSSEAARAYYDSRFGAGSGNSIFGPNRNFARNARFGPGAVGYRPELQFIREGAGMSGSATTADRLYVLVNIAPNFNQIVRVDTFNILGNAQNAAGGGQGIGGVGGIGGGGAGGAGGGLF